MVSKKLYKKNPNKYRPKPKPPETTIDDIKKILEGQNEVEDLTYFFYKKGNQIEGTIACAGKLAMKVKGLTVTRLVDILRDLGVAEKKAMQQLKLHMEHGY